MANHEARGDSRTSHRTIGRGTMNVGVEFRWNEAGKVRLDIAGKPEFPKLPAEPGIYALLFSGVAGTTVYIGEAENLQRRVAHYRNPGPSQATNIRLNERMRSHLVSTGRIRLRVITEARVQVDGSAEACDLSNAFARRFLENAALLVAASSGQKLRTCDEFPDGVSP